MANTTTKTHPSGLAKTFTTTCDRKETPKSNKNTKKRSREKKREESKKKEKSERKKEKDLSNVECFACGEAGHYANSCPSRKKASEEPDSEECLAHLTWNANIFSTYQVNSAVHEHRFGRNEVLIDNQANICIVHPSLLRDVKPAEQSVKINGVGGHQFSVSETRYLDPLFHVYAKEDTRANILSLSEVEDQYLVTYRPNFILYLIV